MKIIKIENLDQLSHWIEKTVPSKRKSQENYKQDQSTQSIYSKFNVFKEYNILTDGNEEKLYYGCGCYDYDEETFIIGSRLICGVNTIAPLCAEFLLPYQIQLASPGKKIYITFNLYNKTLGEALFRSSRKDNKYLLAANFKKHLVYCGVKEINNTPQQVWEFIQ